MLVLGRVIAGVGGLAALVGFICQMILVGYFYGDKAKDGYFAYVRYISAHPLGFFTYVFKELRPDDWRKRLVKPWLIGLLGGFALVAVGGLLIENALHP